MNRHKPKSLYSNFSHRDVPEDDNKEDSPDNRDNDEVADALNTGADAVGSLSEWRINAIRDSQELDNRMGFSPLDDQESRLGWLVNMQPTLAIDTDYSGGKAAIDFYFVQEDAGTFKATVLYEPYFFVICKPGSEPEVEEYLLRRFEKQLLTVEKLKKDDLTLQDHLIGNQRTVLKLSFHNVTNLMAVRKALSPIIERNKKSLKASHVYSDITDLAQQKQDPSHLPGLSAGGEATNLGGFGEKGSRTGITSAKLKASKESLDSIIDMREFDVPYYVRAAMDNDFRVGYWYNVKQTGGRVTLEKRNDRVERADPVVLAFDIETTKQPLKFPDASNDCIMMISYMIDGNGFLITNREIVQEDIGDFDYTPKPEFNGPFIIFNENDEKALLRRFFDHIQETRPNIFVTYNGDFFDWPFVETRAKHFGMDMKKEIGFSKNISGVYTSTYAAHMDALCWVKRDSYLPVGSQGLKAVTTAKLGYNPMELDPEDMTRFASEQPQTLAQYSVSDAVATYYLYMKYVHPFIFSLCNIIPMHPDDVLRRGSGTLCETLLMVEAFKANILMPNKHADEIGKLFEGHLLESETYVGGHVEALEAGVFRSDLPCKFKLVPEAFQTLIDEVDRALQFSIVEEGNLKVDDVTNYDEVREDIIKALNQLKETPNRDEEPLIYHLDVAAMYPNIILTNRLQPDAMVDEGTCAGCHFNEGPDTLCQRKMEWSWRGEYFPATRGEYNMIRNQLETEKFPKEKSVSYGNNSGGEKTKEVNIVSFHDLSHSEQNNLIKKRISEYSRKVYRRVHENRVVLKESIVCQRENPFYVNTVRSFRDRRYEYKGLLKTWKKSLDVAVKSGDAAASEEAKKLTVVYDSLQLAHKCILNSFYGYVMRRGARWYSMEMAGIVCLTGAKIIQLARTRIDQIGRPLELDTDGIWCILPKSFPEQFTFQLKNGKQYPISYPCVMLNHLVHDKFTNHQYHELKLTNGETLEYEVRAENSIFFEVDGPYRAMILPSSTEEDKLLKKRYAVFNHNGSLAELKGFEVKRRGELKLVKIFQSEIFSMFLNGKTLEECYASVATLADAWLDVLYSKGADLTDNELIDLISENRSMSKSLAEYGSQKSTSISTAKRLAEFLGDQMVKEKGLNCKFIISTKPAGLPVSERAIPVAIFQDAVEPHVRKHFLRKWLKDPGMNVFDIRDILDWQYYLDRFGAVIMKVITIPAAMQKVSNPVPRVRHPDWLLKRLASRDDKLKQHRITDAFKPLTDSQKVNGDYLKDVFVNDANSRMDVDDGDVDMEDFGGANGERPSALKGKLIPVVNRKGKKRVAVMDVEEEAFDENEPAPLITGDYNTWLKYQKRKWKNRRAEMQADRELYGEGGRIRKRNINTSANDVQNFFRMQTESILSSTWEILQIATTDVPGEFRVWALVNDQLHNIKLHVPRIFYVNSRVPDPSGIVTASEAAVVTDAMGRRQLTVIRRQRQLPRSRPCLYLYECSMPEKFFLDNNEIFQNLFSNYVVEGVYETKTPLLFRAVTHLGCLLNVSKERRQIGPRLDDGFHLLDLNRTSYVVEPGSIKQQPYLSESKIKNLNCAYLYHSSSSSNLVQVFGLFFSTKAKAGSLNSGSGDSVNSLAKIFIVDPGRNDSQVPNLKRLYRECEHLFSGKFDEEDTAAISQLITSSMAPKGRTVKSKTASVCPIFRYQRELDFDVSIHATEQEALLEINRSLIEYQQHQLGPTLLLLQTPRTPRQLMEGTGINKGGISVIREFPYFSVPAHKQDRAFPAIGWQTPTLKRMFSHLSLLDEWLQDQLVVSRYADIPLCNLEQDYLAFMADVFLARKLFRNDMLGWMSQSGSPDLGGYQEDDFHLELDEMLDPEVNVPGVYASVCIEIDIHELAQNSIMMSHLVNDLEGSVAGNGFDKLPQLLDQHLKKNNTLQHDDQTLDAATSTLTSHADSLVDSNEFSPDTFAQMKNLIKSWETEASQNKNRISALLLGNLHRWITGGGGTSASASALQTFARSYDGINSTASTTASRFFDPALRDIVHSMMRKVFMQLLGEFRRLGATIVHARFNKLIVATSKSNAKAAQGYITYVIQTIHQTPVFALLDLNIKTIYEVVVWMDYYNFGGLMRVEEEVEVDPSEIENFETLSAQKPRSTKSKLLIDSDSEDEDLAAPQDIERPATKIVTTLQMVSDWNIAEYLPPAIQTLFNEVINLYLKQFAQVAANARKQKVGIVNKKSSDAKSATTSGAIAGSIADDTATALQAYIDVELKRILLTQVGKIVSDFERSRKEDPENLTGMWSYPIQPGSHMDPPPSKNPALEFIKSVCAVFGLEVRKYGGIAVQGTDAVIGAGGTASGSDGLVRRVQMLKRDLLNLIGVREFAPEARFANPCQPFRLPLVVCEYCHVVRELDLTRDPSLMPDGEDSQKQWECSECRFQQDKSEIEARLIDIVEQRLLAWQLQDTKCRKCRQVKAENLSLTCSICYTAETSNGLSERKQALKGEYDTNKRGDGKNESGFTTVISIRSQLRLMRVLKNIAEIHGMEYLSDKVDWVLQFM
ncbi:DNA polymerase epsilon catalytic subunit [Nowakowskiella sp. JEL0407]|nr:DNA polymerase epsilon catalytic subunit [Nowakowskiella sp. JEL0407]